MFYLLDDNKIINSEELEIKKLIGKDVITFKRYGDFFCSTNKIKKQSENVCDLIEVGDLIIGSCKEVLIVRENLYDDKEILGLDSLVIGYEDITAIYKPNSRGDYIKVWEKKMEV